MAKRGRDTTEAIDVLLTSKSELWQSYQCKFMLTTTVLLTSKSELWQSYDRIVIRHRKYCLPQNLNYGKADDVLALKDKGYNRLCTIIQLSKNAVIVS